MGERTMISGRGAMLVALAAALGAAAGASWQRRATGLDQPFGPEASNDRSAPGMAGSAGFLPAGFVPPGIVEVPSKVNPPARIRDHSRNLFEFTESPEERAIRLENERLEMLRQKREQEERDRFKMQQQQQQADDLARAAAEKKWLEDHPRPPAVTLALIGKIGPPRAPMAIFAGADGEVYTARVGETIARKFKLLSFDFEAATIGYAPELVAAQPDWAAAKTVLRMGVR